MSVAEIRPRQDKRGYDMTHGELRLWYGNVHYAIGYAVDCTSADEIRVFNEAGEVVQTLHGNRRSGGGIGRV